MRKTKRKDGGHDNDNNDDDNDVLTWLFHFVLLFVGASDVYGDDNDDNSNSFNNI